MESKIIGFILLVLAYIVLAPLAVIWSMNMLFPVLNIPANFDTWCAIIVLGTFVRSTVTVKK